MWVSWVGARKLVVGLVLVPLAFVCLELTPFLLIVLFLDSAPGSMDARADPVGRLLRILVLALALWVALEALDFRGPDPDGPRYVLDGPSEHELGPQGCAPFC